MGIFFVLHPELKTLISVVFWIAIIWYIALGAVSLCIWVPSNKLFKQSKKHKLSKARKHILKKYSKWLNIALKVFLFSIVFWVIVAVVVAIICKIA